MIGLTQLGTETLILLAPLLPFLNKAGEALAKRIGESAYEKGKAIHETIRRKFASDQDEDAAQALKRLIEKPVDEDLKSGLAKIIEDKAAADGRFANELEKVVREAKRDPNFVQFVTTIQGNAHVGQILNIGHVENINLNDD